MKDKILKNKKHDLSMSLEDKKVVYSPHDVSELLGLGLSKTYELFKNEELPCFKIGTRYFVKKDRFNDWLNEKSVSKVM